MDRNARHLAKVEWFDGAKGIGLARLLNGAGKCFVQERAIQSDFKQFFEGDLVTFGVVADRRGRFQGHQARLLKEETDVQALVSWLQDRRLSSHVRFIVLARLNRLKAVDNDEYVRIVAEAGGHELLSALAKVLRHVWSPRLAHEFVSRLSLLVLDERGELVRCLDERHRALEFVRKASPAPEACSALAWLLGQKEDGEEVQALVLEFAQTIPSVPREQRPGLLRALPLRDRVRPEVLSVSPPGLVCETLAPQWEAPGIDQERLAGLLAQALARVPIVARQSVVFDFPAELRSRPEIISLLPKRDVAELVWDSLQAGGGASPWRMADFESRILLICRILWEGAPSSTRKVLTELLEQEEDPADPATILCKALLAGSIRHEAELDSLMEGLIQKLLGELEAPTDPLFVAGLLPLCESLEEVSLDWTGPPLAHLYCEGKEWRGEAWCPRGRGGCSISPSGAGRDTYRLQGARLEPRRCDPWYDWTLVELLDALQVPFKRFTVGAYVLKVGGAVNRLNEIRALMKCSHCGAYMRSDKNYSIRLEARYNATVFNCMEPGYPHDRGVYLSHCWACRRVLDSRASRVKVEDYHLCLGCGSGPQHSRRFRQGDLCPSCGRGPMVDSGNRWMSCPSCSHAIKLPPSRLMTGPPG